MAASQSSKLLHSKLSTSLRHVACLRSHSTAAASSISLAGKLPFFATTEKPKLAQTGADLKLNGRVDWPAAAAAFSHQQFAVANKRRLNYDDNDDVYGRCFFKPQDGDIDYNDDSDDDDDDDDNVADFDNSSDDCD